ncbi:ATP-dependent zinc metalloprotease FtsH 3 [compost metagenome]
MATADQIKMLIKSHGDNDNQRFYATALQIASREARLGHTKLANDLKNIIEKYQFKSPKPANQELAFNKNNNDLDGLIEFSMPHIHRGTLVLDEQTFNRIELIIHEQRQRNELGKYGLHPRNKILFVGAPGTGKTLTANILASELKLPLYKVVLETLISKFMGDTANKLRNIFDFMKDNIGIYLFDEFDAIGSQRNLTNDVGEIRRILNSFLILLEQSSTDSIIIAATNHPELLDAALNRRFDDIIKFDKPTKKEIKTFIESRISPFKNEKLDWDKIYINCQNLSLGDISKAFDDAAKEVVLYNKGHFTNEILLSSLNRRIK